MFLHQAGFAVAKPRDIELEDGTVIPILYEDRSVLALDKPAGWLMVPSSWEKTARNLQLALESSINAGDFWAKSRNIKFLRFVHRLDADTSGTVLFVKSPGATKAYSELFESRKVEKLYLAIVQGVPAEVEWKCTLSIAPDLSLKGKMRVLRGKADIPEVKDAETHFRLLKSAEETSLIAGQPLTGRTHQIRVHLAACGYPVLGDPLYGPGKEASERLARTLAPPRLTLKRGERLGLRAIALAYPDPFTRKLIRIEAPFVEFVRSFGFEMGRDELFGPSKRRNKS